MKAIVAKFVEFYERNETKVDLGFFVGGFLFDIVTLSDIDDPLAILQQVVYLTLIFSILIYDALAAKGRFVVGPKLSKVWQYRHLALHFILGSLLSVYSLFFLKSSSLFTSIIFVLAILGIMIANELSIVQKGATDLKVALAVVCLFSFFSMMFPIALGFVGWVPFLLAAAATGGVLYGLFCILRRKMEDDRYLLRHLVGPGTVVILVFFLFYLIGWIPPVPLAIKKLGIYHNVEKIDGNYILSYQKAWWKFWQSGAQDFLAEPGDRIYVFVSIFSPTRFDDQVILHWMYKDPKRGWQSTDRVPLRIVGGRQQGFRGYATKQNFQEGEGRISVETTDGREIGRIYFEVTRRPEIDQQRFFENESY